MPCRGGSFRRTDHAAHPARNVPRPPAIPAAYLAALIDEQARSSRLPAASGQERGAALGAADAGGPATLIWVEGAAAAPSPDAGRGRGMIVAAHGPGQAAAERSFVISFPAEAGHLTPRLPAVLSQLQAMGWSLLARRRRAAATGRADIAVLVNTARLGAKQRLWLAEPVPALRPRPPRHGRPALVPRRAASAPPGLHVVLEARRRATGFAAKGGASNGAAE